MVQVQYLSMVQREFPLWKAIVLARKPAALHERRSNFKTTYVGGDERLHLEVSCEPMWIILASTVEAQIEKDGETL